MAQLASRFRKTGVKEHVEAAVHDCREHLRFVTEGLIILCALTVLGWDDKDTSAGSDLNMTPQELMEKVAEKIMNEYVLTDYRNPTTILKMQPPGMPQGSSGHPKQRFACGYPGCPKTFAHDGVLRQRHRAMCPYVRFVTTLDPETAQETDERLAPPTIPSSETRKEDYKYNYSCALLRAGLLDWARHDAVREGDSQRVLDMWKYDFLHFHLNNHTNYSHIGFTVIAQQAGLVSSRMSATIKHNRFANLKGGSGHNVSLDYAMELYNGAVKPELKGRGQLTSATINRVGKCLYQMQLIQSNFDQQVQFFSSIGRHGTVSLKDDIATLVSELRGDNVFLVEPGRCHLAFPDFPLS